jgi:hypothetical protein
VAEDFVAPLSDEGCPPCVRTPECVEKISNPHSPESSLNELCDLRDILGPLWANHKITFDGHDPKSTGAWFGSRVTENRARHVRNVLDR